MKTIVISGVIGWDATAKDLRKALTEANNQPVRIEINSPGGFVYEGIEMFNLLKQYKGRTECVIMSMAASMASYIPLACDKIKAMSNATYMIHNALTVAVGNHNQLRKTAAQLENISQLLANAYHAKTGKPMKEIRRMMDEETFLYGAEMHAAGFVDEIMQAEPDAKPDKSSAVTQAQAALAQMWATMKDSAEAQTDLQRAAALLPGEAMQAELPGIDGEGTAPAMVVATEPEAPQAPYPNEHACRLREPKEFKPDSFRRSERKHEGKTYDVIIGRLKGSDTMTEQAFRYSRDKWTVRDASAHCKAHKGQKFEPAGALSGFI